MHTAIGGGEHVIPFELHCADKVQADGSGRSRRPIGRAAKVTGPRGEEGSRGNADGSDREMTRGVKRAGERR